MSRRIVGAAAHAPIPLAMRSQRDIRLSREVKIRQRGDGVDFGIVTRYREHAQSFGTVFFETKDVGGAFLDPPYGTIPMVSAFGDNRVGRAHPEWVQTGEDGSQADRTLPYFDWTCLCPSRAEVRNVALSWVREARRKASVPDFRLDDATFAREGYCHCEACRIGRDRDGRGFEAHRLETIARFTDEVRKLVPGRLFFTLFPDPYPGHLANRFGVDVDRLARVVDAFVVPVYDLAYTTTYWLEVLAQGFRDRLRGHPFYIELYGLDVPEPALAKAARVSARYAPGVLVAYDRDLERLRRLEADLKGAGRT